MKTILDDLKLIQDELYDEVMGILKPEEALLKAKLLAQSLIPLINPNQIGYIERINDSVPTKIIADALLMLRDKSLPNENDDSAWHIHYKKEKIINDIEFSLRIDLLNLIINMKTYEKSDT